MVDMNAVAVKSRGCGPRKLLVPVARGAVGGMAKRAILQEDGLAAPLLLPTNLQVAAL